MVAVAAGPLPLSFGLGPEVQVRDLDRDIQVSLLAKLELEVADRRVGKLLARRCSSISSLCARTE